VTSYHHGNLRVALVEEAAALARLRGPDGVVLREVARRAGVSHNAAYRHFADREALLAEVAAVGMTRLEAAMRRRLDEVTEQEPVARARARLRATGRAYVEFALAEPGMFEVAFSTSPSMADDAVPSPGPYGLLLNGLDDLVTVGALARTRHAGAAVACWSAVHGFAALHLRGPLRDSPADEREQELEQLLDLLDTGLS
jgi:AcrR family transcriptional regulator